MKKNIYGGKSQEVEERFSKAGGADKILVVPIDFAKKAHTAQFCLGNGQFLFSHPLKVWNSVAGADYLEKKLRGAMSRHSIGRAGVILCGEDPPSWTFNFIHRIRASGYCFVGVNARDAKNFRTNTRASSDSLDLNGIAQAVINRRTTEFRAFGDLCTTMRSASRNRRRLMRLETTIKNRIHKSVDVLFPGFLDEASSGISPFSAPCLWLLEEDFSLPKMRRMRDRTLVEGLRKRRQRNPEKTLKMLRELAEKSLPPPPEIIHSEAKSLSVNVRLFREVTDAMFVEENEMARQLVRTPGFYMTSIPGIGVVLAGGIMGEALPESWSDPDMIASYAGIVPREKQTGGRAPLKGSLPKDCNRVLKDFLLQAAHHIGTTLDPAGKHLPEFAEHRLMTHYAELENRQAKSRLGTAKAFLRTVSAMMRMKAIYAPAEWMRGEANVSHEDFILYHEAALESLKTKWSAYDLSGIPENENNLIVLEKQINELKHLNSKKQACLI